MTHAWPELAAAGLQLDWQDANGRPQRRPGGPARPAGSTRLSGAESATDRTEPGRAGPAARGQRQPRTAGRRMRPAAEQALGPPAPRASWSTTARGSPCAWMPKLPPAQARSGGRRRSSGMAAAMAPPSCPSLASLAPGRLAAGAGRPGLPLRRPGDGGSGDSAALEGCCSARMAPTRWRSARCTPLAEANGHAYRPLLAVQPAVLHRPRRAGDHSRRGGGGTGDPSRQPGRGDGPPGAWADRLDSGGGPAHALLLRQPHRDFTERAPVPCATTSPASAAKPARLLHHCRFETLQAHLGAAPTGDAGRSRCAAPASRRRPRSAPITPRKWTPCSASG